MEKKKSNKKTKVIDLTGAGDETELSSQQERVIKEAKRGSSIFVTGSPGSGKSFLIHMLKNKLDKDTLGICSSTGQSAIAIGGSTLHSYTGIKLGKDTPFVIAGEMGLQAKRRWQTTKVLIIDEISMISGELFDKLEHIARIVRKNDKPFGGIQLIIFGDFFQLPPVKAEQYAFEAKSWNTCIQQTIVLDQIFRQQDPDFIQLLQEMRLGKCSDKSVKILLDCAKPKNKNEVLSTTSTASTASDGDGNAKDDGMLPTKLYPHRASVEKENQFQLSRLNTQCVVFTANDTGRAKYALQDCQAPDKLILKIGAQVILLKNLDVANGLGNGSTGIVMAFVNPHLEALDRLEKCTDASSRKKVQEEVSREQKSFSGCCQATHTSGWLPLVRFKNGIVRLLDAKKWEMTMDKEIIACREQVPLNLGWALTIHRSQGMTLASAEIYAQGTFSTAQLYVGVSRLKSLQGLRLFGFQPQHIQVDPKVVQYYESLQTPSSSSSTTLTGSVASTSSTSSTSFTHSMESDAFKSIPFASDYVSSSLNKLKRKQDDLKTIEPVESKRLKNNIE